MSNLAAGGLEKFLRRKVRTMFTTQDALADGFSSPHSHDVGPPDFWGRPDTFIDIAGPCTPMGGGMFRVAEYLVQAQSRLSQPEFRMLETRGGGSAIWSPLSLLRATVLVVAGRVTGRLAGVHVNGAERISVIRKGVLMAVCKAMRVRTIFHLHAAELPSTYSKLSPLGKTLVRGFSTYRTAASYLVGRRRTS